MEKEEHTKSQQRKCLRKVKETERRKNQLRGKKQTFKDKTLTDRLRVCLRSLITIRCVRKHTLEHRLHHGTGAAKIFCMSCSLTHQIDDFYPLATLEVNKVFCDVCREIPSA